MFHEAGFPGINWDFVQMALIVDIVAKLPGPPPSVEEVLQKIQQLTSYSYGSSIRFFQNLNANTSQQYDKFQFYKVCVWCWYQIMDMAEEDATYDKDRIVGLESNFQRVAL